VLGWSMASHRKTDLVVDAVTMAVHRRGGHVPGVIHHSDRGGEGGFKWSSQHLDLGGADGQACRVDDGVDRAVADEVAGSTELAA